MADSASRRRVGWRRRLLLVAGSLLLLAGGAAIAFWLWIRVPPTDASAGEAMESFRRVMNGDEERRPQALSQLAGAIDRHPRDAKLRLWFGLANLEGYLDRRERPYAIRAMRAFERAAELAPDDASIEGWRAFFAYQAADSRGEDLEGPTRALLDAAEADPSFTSFLAAVSLAERPLSSGLPQRTLPPLEDAAGCGDGTTHSCRTSPLFPHGAEGYHATVGDLRIRLGDLEGGKRAYARALQMPRADTWPYRDEFESWTAGAEQRARRLGDGDPSNDPEEIFFGSGDRACAVCHER